MFYVYVIQSIKTGEFYKGLTNNINRRLEQHFSGETNFARGKLPLKLIHVEICQNRNEARAIEKFLKSGYGRETIRELSGLVDTKAGVAEGQTRQT